MDWLYLRANLIPLLDTYVVAALLRQCVLYPPRRTLEQDDLFCLHWRVPLAIPEEGAPCSRRTGAGTVTWSRRWSSAIHGDNLQLLTKCFTIFNL